MEDTKMDWKSEALAVIEDVRGFVSKIEIATTPKSNEVVIYFDVETLEKEKLLVSMSSCGFTIHDVEGEDNFANKKSDNDKNQQEDTSVYETINALLDHKSAEYRKAFANSLLAKLHTIHDNHGLECNSKESC